MKKIVSVILSVLTAASLLCSCSKEADGNNIKTEAPSQAAEASSAQTGENADSLKKDSGTELKEKIKLAYIDVLKESEYDYSYKTEYKEMPQYTLYDFDKDNIPELLVWAKREADASHREITVYKFSEISLAAENAGTMADFEGHSCFRESADGTGIVISVRDSGEDSITRYTLQNGEIVSETLLRRADESDESWLSITENSKFYGSFEFEITNEFDPLYKTFGFSAEYMS